MARLFVGLLAAYSVSAHAAEQLARTDPATWSTNGYLHFHWGMGPGDVAAELRAPNAPIRSDGELSVAADEESEAETSYVTMPSGFEIADVGMVRAVFGFSRGRLYRIELNPVAPGGRWDGWREWTAKFKPLLEKKYGTPIYSSSTQHLSHFAWAPSIHFSVSLMANAVHPKLVFADGTTEVQLWKLRKSRREEAERAALKPTLDKL